MILILNIVFPPHFFWAYIITVDAEAEWGLSPPRCGDCLDQVQARLRNVKKYCT